MNKKGKKRKSAVALGYEPENDLAPYVKAKGRGYIAEQIIEQAKEHDIPIQEDPSLVELLSQLEIHEAIPPDLYEVVAELFAFLYRVDQQMHEKTPQGHAKLKKGERRDGEKKAEK
ncbi:EscU/YscU/HrcU family type III secretion system export apparatus switch protein [Aliibacillus thermotolerans]|uniref:EscU/YscU/HrcU family type III secretion system export apparatus switch protein n=1 Tax=Aliibacillus thermotolerans TaxID=1834418 RepID=A0ABW0U6V5_9BACI|nr:EscU/YscU/HrcU family type III secretion system export apparatus switch protein [Aliibacillus thermotolerans]MDA3130630.1 hypothetical protein [Aliibacillus thermotolerans]